MSQIIKIEHLNLWYEKGKPMEVHALKDINLEIEKGDYVAFFGPSGCGKTSMLYSISGIDRFQDGKVLINGRDISPLTNQELAIFRQTGIGIVFQQFNLVPSLNVLKNVALPMLFVGIKSEKAEEEAKKLLVRMDIMKYAERYPYELSGGQQQRVGIARALANNPPIIIADEPLGNLDSVNAQLTLDFLKELNEKDGRTVIMVTHEAWSLRDVKTIFHIKDGVILDTEKTTKDTLAASLSKHLYDQISVNGKNDNSNNAEEEKISARILANFLLRGYSMDEITRFEAIVNNRFSSNIDKKELRKLISKSFKDGGVGLHNKKADKVTDYIENIVDKRHDVNFIYDTIAKNPESSIDDEIKSIRNWIVEDYTGKLSEIQVMALDEVISDRIRGYLHPDKVVEVLDLSNNKFGVGLSFRAAQTMSEKLELILSNSIDEVKSSDTAEEKSV